jgi:HEAT repeat protein
MKEIAMPLLGLFGSPNVEKLKAKGDIKGLIKALGYEKNFDIRASAAYALGSIGSRQAVEPLCHSSK